MKIIPYIPFLLTVASMIWITVDIVTDNGLLKVTGEVWRGAAFTWLVYIGGILTHSFWVNAKKNGQNEEIYRENTDL